jgi:hypothetical protein
VSLGPLLVRLPKGTANEGEDDDRADKDNRLLIDDVELLGNGSSSDASAEDNSAGLAEQRVSGESVNQGISTLLWGRSGC